MLVIMLTGCRPEGILSPHELEDVLVDLHKAEGVIYAAGYEREHDSVVSLTYDRVLAQHNLTRAQFDSTLVWYTDHPQFFDKIYPHVLERLTLWMDDEKKRQEEQTGENDETLKGIGSISIHQK